MFDQIEPSLNTFDSSKRSSDVASKLLQVTYLGIVWASSADGAQWDKVPAFSMRSLEHGKRQCFSGQRNEKMEVKPSETTALGG